MRTPLFNLLALPCALAVDVTTHHNNNARTGTNLEERSLTPDLLSRGRFGKLFSLCVEGQIYAQPLIVTDVEIAGGKHDVVYIATMENNIYAFDPKGKSEAPLWHKNLVPQVRYRETEGTHLAFNIKPWIGILSTPVIDSANHRIYVVAKVRISGNDNYYR